MNTHSLSPQTFRKPTVRSPSTLGTGKDWSATSIQEARSLSTISGPLASYSWSRVASALGRLSEHLSGTSAATWHQQVADEDDLEASGPEYRSALIAFFVLRATGGVPLSWSKTASGELVSSVGFVLNPQQPQARHLAEEGRVVC